MKTNNDLKFPYFLVGIGLGVIAGLLWAPRAGEETRKTVRERSNKSLDYLSRRTGKLRESTEGIVQRGRDLFSRQCCDSVHRVKETEKQINEEEGPETLGVHNEAQSH
jgi:gas vesicle protein